MIITFDAKRFGQDAKKWCEVLKDTKMQVWEIELYTGIPRYVLWRIFQGKGVGAENILKCAYFAELDPIEYMLGEDGKPAPKQLKFKLKI